ncbi:hypothetical protein ACFQX6_29500 [Streptosporangium lutulentum]
MPVLRQWGVFEMTDLGPDGEKAREELSDFLVRIETSASRFVERREARRARQAAAPELLPADAASRLPPRGHARRDTPAFLPADTRSGAPSPEVRAPRPFSWMRRPPFSQGRTGSTAS